MKTLLLYTLLLYFLGFFFLIPFLKTTLLLSRFTALMIRRCTPQLNGAAIRLFSSTVTNKKSTRLPSFAEIKAIQLDKYIDEIST